MAGKELVGPLPTITYHHGYDTTRQAYEVPRDTRDLRAQVCADHHPACDCREAYLNEVIGEHRAEWWLLQEAAARALSGHQARYPIGLNRAGQMRFALCLCSGCVIYREARTLLPPRAVDYHTGRVR